MFDYMAQGSDNAGASTNDFYSGQDGWVQKIDLVLDDSWWTSDDAYMIPRQESITMPDGTVYDTAFWMGRWFRSVSRISEQH